MTTKELLDWLHERDLTLVVHGATGSVVLYPADDPELQLVAGPGDCATTLEALGAVMQRWDGEQHDNDRAN